MYTRINNFRYLYLDESSLFWLIFHPFFHFSLILPAQFANILDDARGFPNCFSRLISKLSLNCWLDFQLNPALAKKIDHRAICVYNFGRVLGFCHSADIWILENSFLLTKRETRLGKIEKYTYFPIIFSILFSDS